MKVLNDFESKIFPIEKQTQGKRRPGMIVKVFDCSCLLDLARLGKVSDCSYLKIFSPKQMFQKLLVALAPVKVGNTSENLLNEIHQIIYSLYRAKEITEKIYITTF